MECKLEEYTPRRLQRRDAKKRKRKVIAAVSSVVALGLLGGSAYAYNNLQQRVTTVETQSFLDSEKRPAKNPASVPNPKDPFSGALNILLIGSDERDAKDNSTTTGMRSDTVMIAHISEKRDRVEIVSIPRDSWVTVPSCTLPDGSLTAPHTGKFNAAFSLGGQTGNVGAAVACTIKTVEGLTGVYIDDYVVIDFAGFKGMVNALDGVEFNVKEDIVDPSFSNTVIKAGQQTFDGNTALRYARVRKAIGMDGSDISRIGRQQELLAAIISTAKTKTSNPAAMYNLVGAGMDMITTSPELGNLNSMAGLAWSVKDVKEKNVVFKTVPIVDRGDGANVLWSEGSYLLWNSLKKDEPIEGLSFKTPDKTIKPEHKKATPGSNVAL